MTVRPLDALTGELRARTPTAGKTRVLAIDGPSGSGKTTLAGRLAQTGVPTAKPIPIVHLEDIYPGWDGLRETPDLLVDWVLRPLSEGRPAAYRHWNWERDEWAGLHSVPAADTLIVEGVGSGALACAPFLTMLVWIDAPREVRKARGIERDGETYRPYWERWAALEAEMFATDRTRERADICIDGDSSVPHDAAREFVSTD
ncbi:4-amino-4-deoxy-L-arabinose transferase [Nocardioidaceae bacterium SCSIO 66511]|nr:4-amino-4-deoxy-L-arabinose transferase [Nocardioidaceae bacterium SCSIO 66511]